MTEKTIVTKDSLDTRHAALFVQTASKFKSNIKVSINDKMVNAKSLMCIISLGITNGSQLKITADGADEEDAVKEITSVLQ
ncbi:MAG: HPr family phosphocarrier protein [Clostridia bacterium]|jgi:phosphotransferase system HPr (HPr) family protein|nr:HPr family phosphocarrier protein [Clostridia bacterium]MCI1958932.1 HPr family phosphocarrier protein [Clostridia bacterium]MCI2000223.1 HPr family phosphocarrier protein [Clostridia bacterium]MCI2014612.1 HPr family phosphocarrier protein [Clostridia bacterium]